MTTEELERAAYMAGDTDRAAILAALDDAEIGSQALDDTLLDVQEDAENLRQALENLVEACEEGDPEAIANEVIRAERFL